MSDRGPEGDTPLNAAWHRVVKYARAAGALSTTGSYQHDVETNRTLDTSYGFAQGYGVEPEDLEQLLLYGVQLHMDAILHGTHPINAFSAVASMFLFTGAEFKSNPLEPPTPPAGPAVHKREAIRDCINANPHSPVTADAILNALHVAGWKVVPK